MAEIQYITSVGMAYLIEHMLAFGYRQDTVGHWPIWFGPISASSLRRFPFNPTHRSLPVRGRSRLYHDRFYLRDCHALVSIGLWKRRILVPTLLGWDCFVILALMSLCPLIDCL